MWHHVLENLLSKAGVVPLRVSPTRLQDNFNFEELLRNLSTIARMTRPHLGSRLVSATRLTFGLWGAVLYPVS